MTTFIRTRRDLVRKLLVDNQVCYEGLSWFDQQRATSLEQMWDACPDGGWLFFVLASLKIDEERLFHLGFGFLQQEVGEFDDAGPTLEIIRAYLENPVDRIPNRMRLAEHYEELCDDFYADGDSPDMRGLLIALLEAINYGYPTKLGSLLV